MAGSCLIALVGITALAVSSAQQYTTPVPILKQINRHNEDGSYSYGYEAADGSFKIETKHPTGEVVGKYGYVDDSGRVREVEYGASRRGFEPAGTGINVAPPTLQGNYPAPSDPNADYDDGQYREDPSVYYKSGSERYFGKSQTSSKQQSWTPPQNSWSQSQPSWSNQKSWQQQQPSYRPPAFKNFQSNVYNPPPTQNPAPQYNPPVPYNPPQNTWHNPTPYHNNPQQWHGHPATNFDVNTGSYSVTYSGKR